MKLFMHLDRVQHMDSEEVERDSDASVIIEVDDDVNILVREDLSENIERVARLFDTIKAAMDDYVQYHRTGQHTSWYREKYFGDVAQQGERRNGIA